MNDDIQLPPLPHYIVARNFETVMNYARTAVLADRERRAKKEAKPVVHQARVVLTPDGYAWLHGGGAGCPANGSTIVTLRWTAGGRAWIDSEKNRQHAQKLRANGYNEIADALDGGER